MGKIRTGIKLRVTPEQSRKVQEICFEKGIYWVKSTEIKHLDKPFLFIDEYISFMYKDQEEFFVEERNEEVSAELFIRTNGTCIESEDTTEDNNKGKQMEELKLECLVEGYEGTYFEVGQVWETRGGERFKVKGFDFKTEIYKLTMSEIEDSDEEYYHSQKGEDIQGRESDLDLVKLISTEPIPSEEPQPKTLSEYLKENNAYESFVENCVEAFLKGLAWYKVFKSENKSITLGNIFIWEDTKEGQKYWENLQNNQPENLAYDMNEIIFAEVDRRLAEQDSKPESEPKTLSEYLKENNAYESFVENSVERALSNPLDLESKRSLAKEIDDFFVWDNTDEGNDYWYNLYVKQPKNLVYDMNGIIFAEVGRRIAEQDSKPEFISTEEFDQMLEQKLLKRYMVFVEGKNTPRYIHETKDSAETEAKRLSTKLVGSKVFVVSVVKTFKSKVIVEEI